MLHTAALGICAGFVRARGRAGRLAAVARAGTEAVDKPVCEGPCGCRIGADDSVVSVDVDCELLEEAVLAAACRALMVMAPLGSWFTTTS